MNYTIHNYNFSKDIIEFLKNMGVQEKTRVTRRNCIIDKDFFVMVEIGKKEDFLHGTFVIVFFKLYVNLF